MQTDQALTKSQRAFLAAYRACGTIRGAAEAAGASSASHYRWLRGRNYAKSFMLAQHKSSIALEEEARRRAIEGVAEPVYFEGNVCGHKLRYSDTLLIFLLKANHPAKFGDRIEQRHFGEPVSPVQFYLPENGRRPSGDDNRARVREDTGGRHEGNGRAPGFESNGNGSH